MIEPGEIYFIQKGTGEATGCEIWPGRPGVVISSRDAGACSGTVNIIYLTSSDRPKAFGVTVPGDAFTDAVKDYPNHVALCGQIHAVDKSRLGNYLGRLPAKTVLEIRNALAAANFNGSPFPGSRRTKPRPGRNTKTERKA